MPLYTFCRLGGGSKVAMKIFFRCAVSVQPGPRENHDSSGLRDILSSSDPLLT